MFTRRTFLATTSLIALAGPALAAAPKDAGRIRVFPIPLDAVRLKPSIYADAVETNRRTLLALEPDRLLHNFHTGAGLPAMGKLYGGWEARGIAGHSLGHYLSACALMFAQTGDPAMRERLNYIVLELAHIQAAHGDGYVGGTTVERDGKTVDGKIVFEEIRRGDIRTGGFDINGGWVPLYTWHKVHAGLIDAYRHAHVAPARTVMLMMADYLGTILEGLDDAQMQKLLAAEHGGLNESYADTYALTGDPRWLRLAQRIRHRKVLDPLSRREDILPGLHANTQIPKLIGLARLHELTGDAADATAARFFSDTVLDHHSYVIGGNSEREHFGAPDVIAPRITERTCEACNSYNMLKLTRHLYGWDGEAAHFDFYERTHLNHIMAHQHPETGMFVYFMPLSSGARRTYSTLEDSFWCCVGSGLESHAKHGESIYWHDAETLYVNLFIPSTLEWQEGGIRLDLDTRYPFSERVTLTVSDAPRKSRTIALRLPGWCEAPAIAVNGAPADFARRQGYARITRRWMAGDTITLTLPMTLRAEPTPNDPRLAAFVHGPVVLAADMGPASTAYDGLAPALVAADMTGALEPVDKAAHIFRMAGAKPAALTLKPFFNQYDRRTAVYFPLFTATQWAKEESAFVAAQRERAALDARTVDILHLGEMQPERDHDFRASASDLFSWGGRSARQLAWDAGNWMEFTLAVSPGPMVFSALYWGEEVDKHFELRVEGQLLAVERRPCPRVKRFVNIDYPIPEALTRGKDRITVRFVTKGGSVLVYECRILKAETGTEARK